MTTESKVKKPFYKKWWVWLLAVIIVIAIASSGGETPATKGDAITNETPITNEQAETPKEESKPAPKPVEKAPVVVWENASVIVSFKELNEDGVKLLIENKTNSTLTVQADSIAINGFSSNDITMSDDISPQSKGYAMVQTTELADAGTPETLSGTLRIIDMNSANWDTIDATFTNVSIK